MSLKVAFLQEYLNGAKTCPHQIGYMQIMVKEQVVEFWPGAWSSLEKFCRVPWQCSHNLFSGSEKHEEERTIEQVLTV